MSKWTLAAPTPSDLGDHDVVREGDHLRGRRVALLVTGGIAAMKIPLVARALRRQGAEVVAFASQEALRYVTAETLAWSTVNPIVDRLTAAAEHLSDSAPFSAYLLAPATYNSLNKIAAGIADTVVTAAAASAIGRLEQGRTAVLVAPTMHGSLHNSILCASLARLHGLGVRVIPPRDAYGKHNLPDEQTLVAEVARALSRSPLRGCRILVTGGSPPVPIDGERRLVSRCRGSLGVAIATELHLRGAAVTLIQGDGGVPVPEFVPHRIVATAADYRQLVTQELADGYAAAVFAARGVDYELAPAATGQLPSGQVPVTITLVPTGQVLETVQKAHPNLYVIPFTYEESGSQEQLLSSARARLDQYPCVVASRGGLESAGEPAFLLTRDAAPRPLVSEGAIASAIADQLEGSVKVFYNDLHAGTHSACEGHEKG